ncbi:hypothetical protein, partial [Neisseria sicca]|uniref:hypothetical protein n=1 Tax=Neisseria sicca TaxID=490 RepID=UPI001C997B12
MKWLVAEGVFERRYLVGSLWVKEMFGGLGGFDEMDFFEKGMEGGNMGKWGLREGMKFEMRGLWWEMF